MENYFAKVKDYLLELEYNIVSQDEADQVFVISNEEAGISNMVLAIAEPILIIEQGLFTLKRTDAEVLRKLLVKNRDIVHGAFVLDEDGKSVIFRDTLQIENLDLNELEGSLNSLTMLLSEFTDEIIEFAQMS